jgi:hypothetical protein
MSLFSGPHRLSKLLLPATNPMFHSSKHLLSRIRKKHNLCVTHGSFHVMTHYAYESVTAWSLKSKRLLRDDDHPSPKDCSCIAATPLLVLQWRVVGWNLLFLFFRLNWRLSYGYLLLNIVETIRNSLCCWVWYVAVQ